MGFFTKVSTSTSSRTHLRVNISLANLDLTSKWNQPAPFNNINIIKAWHVSCFSHSEKTTYWVRVSKIQRAQTLIFPVIRNSVLSNFENLKSNFSNLHFTSFWIRFSLTKIDSPLDFNLSEMVL